MIIAWVLSMIVMVSSLIGHLEHSAALRIRLLAIENQAHAAFVAAETNLIQCELQLHDSLVQATPMVGNASGVCEVTLVDANATSELIRVRVAGYASSKDTARSMLIHTKQTQLESMVYRNKRDQTVERLSWRMLWSVTQPAKSKPF